MKIRELLERDPVAHALPNNGQARIDAQGDPSIAERELRAELESFVCEGEYAKATERILETWLTSQSRGSRSPSAWVSGFFGSGKSHLLKMLGHLWVNTRFEDGTSARTFVPALPQTITGLLREIDRESMRAGKPPVAAAGTLLAHSQSHVRCSVLNILLKAADLPANYSLARFCLWLRGNGQESQVRAEVEKANREWSSELAHLFVSPHIALAILKLDPSFAGSEREARDILRKQYQRTDQAGDITTEEFMRVARAALGGSDPLPPTLLILDEVQQFIGDSSDRAVIITELAEALQTQLGGRIMLVASGQSSLTSTAGLQKLTDRFRIPVQLSDTDVEVVTRRVLLAKKPRAEAAIRTCLDQNAGELSRHLRDTTLASRPADSQTDIVDYPLLPARRRFLEECFKRLEQNAGTRSQLRSQLHILHSALRSIGDRPLGWVIPCDILYDALYQELIQTGVLLNEISTKIRALDDGTDEGRLQKRLAATVFLIGKLSREAGVDTGVRATATHIADLIIDDIGQDSAPFRRRIAEVLERLADSGVFLRIGDEYRMQTTEGAAWESEFKERSTKALRDPPELNARREELLRTAIQEILRPIRPLHGESKVARSLTLHASDDTPPPASAELVVWMRTGFGSAHKEVIQEAQRRGQTDAVIHLFVPKQDADDLHRSIAEWAGAKAVLDHRGTPATKEGQEARQSMIGRVDSYVRARDSIVARLLSSACVYQGGGAEVFGETLAAKLRSAVEVAQDRLYPQFHEGDHKGWSTALKRAREGSDHPLQVVGVATGQSEHPVLRRVLETVGNGQRGSEIRRSLEGAPTGWPRDAIDAALIILHSAGTLSATQNGQSVPPRHLDQNKISTTDFRPESVQVGTPDRLKVRGLIQALSIPVRSGEEEARAPQFVEALRGLAEEAGGASPLPEAPRYAALDQLKRQSGNALLAALAASAETLSGLIPEWQKRGEIARKRKPTWDELQSLLAQAHHLPIATEVAADLEAIHRQRSLLADPDPVPPIKAKVSQALRGAVIEAERSIERAQQDQLACLAADPEWNSLAGPERQAILRKFGFEREKPASLGSDAELLATLSRDPLHARYATAAAAPERAAGIRTALAQRSAPSARRYSIPAATLADAAAVDQWIATTALLLRDAVKQGPIIVP